MTEKRCYWCRAQFDAPGNYCSKDCEYAKRQRRKKFDAGLLKPAPVLLAAGAAPRPHPVVVEDDGLAKVRRLLCRQYVNCLKYAAVENWAGFTCNACPASDLYSIEELRAQAPRICSEYAGDTDYHVETANRGEA